MTAGSLSTGFYLRFGDEAEFVVRPDGRSIRWHTFAGEPDATVVHLLLDHVIPRAITRFGRIVLHGSCIGLDSIGCVAIVGRSGSGKSTLAAASLNQGCTVLSDDAVVVHWQEGLPLVAPAYPGLRLTDRSVALAAAQHLRVGGSVSRFSDKTRMIPPPDGRAPNRTVSQLCAIVTIPNPTDDVRMRTGHGLARLPPSSAAIELLRHSFHLNAPMERAELLERVPRLASHIPVFRIDYRHNEASLARAIQQICELLPSTAVTPGSIARDPPALQAPPI
jgi:hypothetical protein